MSRSRLSTERHTRLFEIFKKAVEDERRAQNMYREAMRLCDDAQIRAVLEGFEKQEKDHEVFLQKLYRKYKYALLGPEPEEEVSAPFLREGVPVSLAT